MLLYFFLYAFSLRFVDIQIGYAKNYTQMRNLYQIALYYVIFYAFIGSIVRLAIDGILSQKQKLLLQKQTIKNELALLRSQVNPHFLFNSLNTIHSYVNSNDPNAAKAVIKLSDIMRYMLYDANREMITIDKKKKDKNLGLTEWKLSNGIKVIIKPTEFKDDEILFSAFSVGGSSVHKLKDDVSAGITSDVVNSSGIAEFDAVELDKKLAGKTVNVNPYINENIEGMRGSSTQKDFETMLQLIYLYFTHPRVDQTAYSSLITRYKAFVENRSANPSNAFRDSISVTMAQYHPRRRPFTAELLDEANFKRVDYIYKNRFGDPSNFTFLFVGNLDMKTVQPLIEKYLGGLPTVNRTESWKDLNIEAPKGVIKKTIHHKMETPKASVFVCFSGDYEYNLYTRMQLDLLKEILFVRYTETIREEQSGSYGVSVRMNQSHYPQQEYDMRISFECAPEKVDELKAIVFEEIAKIKKEGPVDKDLKSTKESKLKSRKENTKENRFWLNALQHNYYHNENILDNEKYNKMVNSISKEDIMKIANKYLIDDNFVEIVMLPKK